jgi:hypothetical protein
VRLWCVAEYTSGEEEEEEESGEGQEDGPFNENNMDFGKFMQMWVVWKWGRRWG